MKKDDLKKLALMGITGGVLLAQGTPQVQAENLNPSEDLQYLLAAKCGGHGCGSVAYDYRNNEQGYSNPGYYNQNQPPYNQGAASYQQEQPSTWGSNQGYNNNQAQPTPNSSSYSQQGQGYYNQDQSGNRTPRKGYNNQGQTYNQGNWNQGEQQNYDPQGYQQTNPGYQGYHGCSNNPGPQGVTYTQHGCGNLKSSNFQPNPTANHGCGGAGKQPWSGTTSSQPAYGKNGCGASGHGCGGSKPAQPIAQSEAKSATKLTASNSPSKSYFAASEDEQTNTNVKDSSSTNDSSTNTDKNGEKKSWTESLKSKLQSYRSNSKNDDDSDDSDSNNPNNTDSSQDAKSKLQSYRSGSSRYLTLDDNASQDQGSSKGGLFSKKLTEKDLLSQLNSEGKSTYNSLSSEGKALALKLANQECKGKNTCKGLNACSGKDHSCAGKGSCAGTSEKPFNDKNVAVKVAAQKMAEKRSGLNSR